MQMDKKNERDTKTYLGMPRVSDGLDLSRRLIKQSPLLTGPWFRQFRFVLQV